MNQGYQNEYDFIRLFNNKYLHELDSNSQAFLKDLFEEELNDNEQIKSWKNKMPQKTDIFIKYKNYIKNISLKCGKGNSVHQESVQDFQRYLVKIGIPYKTIDKYMSYHYGYKKNIEGTNDYSIRLNADEYKELYQNEIDIFNTAINKTRIIVDMIDRFVVRGKNSDYDIDALVCGTIDDYVWIKKYDLYDLILSKKELYFSSPHISCMTIGPKKRNINRDENNSKERYIISVRWGFIREDIIDFKNKKYK